MLSLATFRPFMPGWNRSLTGYVTSSSTFGHSLVLLLSTASVVVAPWHGACNFYASSLIILPVDGSAGNFGQRPLRSRCATIVRLPWCLGDVVFRAGFHPVLFACFQSSPRQGVWTSLVHASWTSRDAFTPQAVSLTSHSSG